MKVRRNMDLFDIKYVYMDWDDALKGKKVFVGDVLQGLRGEINDNVRKAIRVESSGGDAYPFRDEHGTLWGLVYYDPNYDCKLAYRQGKQIQYKSKDSSEPWIDCFKEPTWCDDVEYRVKPEEPKKHRKTNRELAQWVASGYGECMCDDIAMSCWRYVCDKADMPVKDGVKIRGWCEEEWREPEVEKCL